MLASVLQEKRTGYFVSRTAKENETFKADVANAKRIAERLKEELPTFLAALAEEGRSWAMVVGINQYPPFDHRWPNFGKRELKNYSYSAYQCRQYLFGVPKHLALWALSQGMRTEIAYGHQTDSDRQFYTDVYKYGLGLKVHW